MGQQRYQLAFLCLILKTRILKPACATAESGPRPMRSLESVTHFQAVGSTLNLQRNDRLHHTCLLYFLFLVPLLQAWLSPNAWAGGRDGREDIELESFPGLFQF